MSMPHGQNTSQPQQPPRGGRKTGLVVIIVVVVAVAVAGFLLWFFLGRGGGSPAPAMQPLALPATMREALQPAAAVPLAPDDERVCSISPSGRYVLTEPEEGTLRLWEYKDGHLTSLEDISLMDTGLTMNRPVSLLSGRDVSWAPDEGGFVFCMPNALRYIVDSDIFLYSLASKSLRCLTDDGSEPALNMAAGMEGVSIDTEPLWAADGKTIYYSTYSMAGAGISSIPVGGGQPRQIVELGRGGWANGLREAGGRLFFANTASDRDLAGIYVAEGAQGKMLAPTEAGMVVEMLGATPDGQYVLYHRVNAAYSQPNAIAAVVLNTATGEEFPLPTGPVDIFGEEMELVARNAAFSPDGTRLALAVQDNNNTAGGLIVYDMANLNAPPACLYWLEDEIYFSPTLGPANRYSTLRWMPDNSFIVFQNMSLYRLTPYGN